MCALSEDTLTWEILAEYKDRFDEDIDTLSMEIADKKKVPVGDVIAIIKRLKSE